MKCFSIAIVVLFTATLAACNKPREDIKFDRTESLQAEIRRNYPGSDEAIVDACPHAASPVEATLERLADTETTRNLLLILSNHPTEEDCRVVTKFVVALNILEDNRELREDWIPILTRSYHAKGETLEQFQQKDWNLLRYHVYRELLADYLFTCHTTFQTENVVYGCENASYRQGCRDHIVSEIDRDLGVKIYPAVTDPADAARKLHIYGADPNPSERTELELRIYASVTQKHLQRLGQGYEPTEETLDYADTFMPYLPGEWQEVSLVFTSLVCSNAITDVRKEGSYSLWSDRAKADYWNVRWNVSFPNSLKEFCNREMLDREMPDRKISTSSEGDDPPPRNK